MTEDTQLKELETALKAVAERLRADFQAIRGNRPSVDLIENIRVNYYDQPCAINQLGTLSVVPPRSVHIAVWDKSAVGAVAKAIEGAKIGLSVSNEGNVVRATLSPLGNERREELVKLVKKTAEGARIQIRHHRDESVKKAKAAGDEGTLTEDQVFKLRERIQKAVDAANGNVEDLVGRKLGELGE